MDILFAKNLQESIMQRFMLLLLFITVIYSQQAQKLQYLTSIHVAHLHSDAKIALNFDFDYTTQNITQIDITWEGSAQLTIKRTHKNRLYLQRRELQKLKEKSLLQRQSTSISATYDTEDAELKIGVGVNPRYSMNATNITIKIHVLKKPHKFVIKWPLGYKRNRKELSHIAKSKLVHHVQLEHKPSFFSSRYPAGSKIYEKVRQNNKTGAWKMEIEDRKKMRTNDNVVIYIRY